MINVSTILENILNVITSNTGCINVCFILDISGSTSQPFLNKTILDKEVQVLKEYVFLNKNNNYKLITFSTNYQDYGIVSFDTELNVIDIPPLHAYGGTNTASPLQYILENLKIYTPEKIIIITDGETGSTEKEIQIVVKKLKENNVLIEIIAVSKNTLDLSNLTENEERGIPGMDMINHVKNNIDKLSIYNTHENYKNTPYVGCISSYNDIKNLKFNDYSLKIPIHEFLEQFCNALTQFSNELHIEDDEYKKIIIDTGKLLACIFIELDTTQFFIFKICECYSIAFKINYQLVEKLLNFGFSCSKKKIPIILTNFERHIRDAGIKKQEFSNAIDQLKLKGTTLDEPKIISIPTYRNPVCIIIENKNIITDKKENLKEYPNSVLFNKTFFAIDGNEQATRIAVRTFATTQGFKNQMGNDIIFYIHSIMLNMFISGIDMETHHMQELKKLAIIMLKIDIRVDNKTIIPLYELLKNKTLPRMHFTKPETHVSLHKEKIVNTLNLIETIWWASMMSMVGLFNEQLAYYKTTLEGLNINLTENDFLNYMRETYRYNITGKYILEYIMEEKYSIITLESFLDNEKVYKIKNHGANCNSQIWCSESEKEHFKTSLCGCPFCHGRLTENDFEVVLRPNTTEILRSNAEQIRFIQSHINNFVEIENKIQNISINDINTETKNNENFNNEKINQLCITEVGIKHKNTNKQKIIIMQSVVGGGKSYLTKILTELLPKNKKVLIVSTDYYCMQGMSIQQAVAHNITELRNNKHKYDIIIVDVCNDSNFNLKNIFKANFTNAYCIIVKPNLTNEVLNNDELFNQYACWTLKNVLLRNEIDSYLNPIKAGLKICVEVHLKKLNNLFPANNFKNYTNYISKSEILNEIDCNALQYENYLKNYNLNETANYIINLLN